MRERHLHGRRWRRRRRRRRGPQQRHGFADSGCTRMRGRNARGVRRRQSLHEHRGVLRRIFRARDDNVCLDGADVQSRRGQHRTESERDGLLGRGSLRAGLACLPRRDGRAAIASRRRHDVRDHGSNTNGVLADAPNHERDVRMRECHRLEQQHRRLRVRRRAHGRCHVHAPHPHDDLRRVRRPAVAVQQHANG